MDETPESPELHETTDANLPDSGENDLPTHSDHSQNDDEGEIGGEGWSGEDIEQAYLKALHAMDSVDWSEGELPESEASDAADDELSVSDVLGEVGVGASSSSSSTMEMADESNTQPGMAIPADEPATAGTRGEEPTLSTPAGHSGQSSKFGQKKSASPATELPADDAIRFSPAQIIEAAMFVGGGPLTAKKICSILRGTFENSFVETTIDELNMQYVSEGRPYHIRLGEGGYRMELLPEFDAVRGRVHGTGPREVRLTQDVLEVLAVVAYKQPITRDEIETITKKNVGNLLRQLLRREIIQIERGDQGPQDVHYRTSPRFLSVFGLGSLEDLPLADDVSIR